jgi:hypothetical protein
MAHHAIRLAAFLAFPPFVSDAVADLAIWFEVQLRLRLP